MLKLYMRGFSEFIMIDSEFKIGYSSGIVYTPYPNNDFVETEILILLDSFYEETDQSQIPPKVTSKFIEFIFNRHK